MRAADLFEPGTAMLTDRGRAHLTNAATWLKGVKDSKAEVVVAAFCDPADKTQTAASCCPCPPRSIGAAQVMSGRRCPSGRWTTMSSRMPVAPRRRAAATGSSSVGYGVPSGRHRR